MKKTSKILSVIMATLMVLTLIPMSAFAADYTIALGETITVTVPEELYADCKFTPDEDGTYVVYSDMGEADVDPKVTVYDGDGNEIAYDDDSDYVDTYDFYCIFEAEAGVDYWFEMEEYDGLEAEFDITVSVFGEITHQPTAGEPYVEVTEGADAEYQWYKFGDSFEVTDENAEAREGGIEGEYATYDSENGWTGVVYDEYYGYIECNFFTVMISEDRTIKMTADCDADEFGIWCECGDCDEYWEDIDANDTVGYTVDHACTYNTWGDYEEIPHLKAEITENTKVNTDAQLNAEETGTYLCIVTFDGCRTEVSDEVEISESDPIPDSNKISKADINIRTDIAGLSTDDYEDYIEILTEGLDFADDYGSFALFVEDSNGASFEGEFAGGETYKFLVHLVPESGYEFAEGMDGTVNGEDAETHKGYWVPGGEYGDLKVYFVELISEITVNNNTPEDPDTTECEHSYTDGDDATCDLCEYNRAENCGCKCHQGSIAGFFYKIVLFFQKLFGMNKVCVCGMNH